MAGITICIPDFFLVGAPKCGSTSLDDYLKQHPQIFMAPHKESYHFATDFLSPGNFYFSRENYLKMFECWDQEKIAGESSVLYLASKVAAKNIHDFNPQAKIVALFREPVSMIDSYHSQLVFVGVQKETDLMRALELQEADSRGLIEGAGQRLLPKYLDLIQFGTQLQRYIEFFGVERVHVILFEDLKNNPEGIYRDLVRFLDVDEDFIPEFKILNSQKMPRSYLASRLIENLTPLGHWLGRKGVSFDLLAHIKQRLKKTNSLLVPRPPLDNETKLQIRDSARPEVNRLQEMIGRDLQHWLEPEN